LIDLAQRYMTCGYYAAARAVLERALEIHPCYPTANKMLCDILWHHGDRDQAILLSREFAAKIAHSAFAHFQLGHLLRESGDLDGAESSYRKSLTADRGESFATHHQLADVLSRQGRFDEGIALVRSYVDRHNDDSASHALLGQMLWRADRLNDAEHAYRQAIQYAPNDLELKVALADLISAMGRLDEAIALARSLAERNHDSASVYSLLARLFWRKNDLQAAIEAYRTATVLAPENEGLKVQLFQVLATGGHYDEALSIVHLPELRGSRDPAVHVQIGELFLQAGDLTAAEAAFATAISYDETNEPAKAGQQEVRRRGI
jgi:tetratricopeptide (TPR) repeat protein